MYFIILERSRTRLPEVSIIIPVYNVIKYFEKCMESVLSQKMQDFEVILIDDGSTDGTLDALKRLREQDPRVKYISLSLIHI